LLWLRLLICSIPKKLKLNLLRRGTALNANASRGRRDLVDSNFNDEKESSVEESEEEGERKEADPAQSNLQVIQLG
jgi:hypothetical protein